MGQNVTRQLSGILSQTMPFRPAERDRQVLNCWDRAKVGRREEAGSDSVGQNAMRERSDIPSQTTPAEREHEGPRCLDWAKANQREGAESGYEGQNVTRQPSDIPCQRMPFAVREHEEVKSLTEVTMGLP